MRLVRLRAPAGLENLELVEEADPRPGPGEVLVRIRAASLNFRDDMVVQGKIPSADGRVPLSDGAGEVIAVGEAVEELEVGDAVVSTFWPDWRDGEMTVAARRRIPGETIESAKRALDRATAIGIEDLKRGLGGLATIGSTAPFVGLFGTTIGIINAFQGMKTEETAGIAAVAGGIAEALVTTAFGCLWRCRR